MKHILCPLASILALALIASCGGEAGSNISFGGAQDMGLFKDLLSEGHVPGTGALDANGFFAEHYIELPTPQCGQNLCLHGMFGLDREFVQDDWLHVLGVGINSPLTLEDLDPAPVDIAVVIDTSGSMQKDDRMLYAIDGLHKLVDALEAEDRLAVITYASQVVELHPLSPVDENTRDGFHAAIDTLEPAGATDMYGGLEAGFVSLLSQAQPDRAMRVILLTDGHPSVGITSGAAITEMAYGYILDGAGLTTVGIGEDANVGLLVSLAEMGAGNAYHLDSVRAIEEVFVDELAYFQSIVAWDVRLEITLTEPYLMAQAFGWDHSFDHYLNQVQVSIPSVALASRHGAPEPGEGRRGGGSALFVDLIPDLDLKGDFDPKKVAEIKLIYRPAGQENSVEQTVSVSSPLDHDELPADDGVYTEAAMEKGFAVLAMFRGLYSACAAASYNYHYALYILTDLEDNAKAWNASKDDEDIRADLVLVAQFMRNLENKGADADDYEPYKPYTGCATTRPNTPLGLALLALLSLCLVVTRVGVRGYGFKR